MISKKIVNIPTVANHAYTGGHGYFILNNSQFHSCRESFQVIFKSNSISFCYATIDIELVDKFFSFIENKIKIPENEQTVFYRTNIVPNDGNSKNYVINIKVSDFWMQNEVYKGLFTLFLRCAVVFYKGDFDNAILSYPLSNRVRHVINWFLKGNIYPTDTAYLSGFVSKYEKQNNLASHFTSKKIKRLVFTDNYLSKI